MGQRTWVCAVAAVLLHSTVGAAQAPAEVGFLIGTSSFQLATPGTAVVANLSGTLRPVPALYVEIGATYLDYAPQFEEPFAPQGVRDRRLFPEVGVQVAPLRGRASPYLGVGAGLSVSMGYDRAVAPTVHLTSGVRVYLKRRWAVRGDLRIRSVDPFGFATADVMFGVSRRLGG